MADIELIIRISEEDFEIMKHNIAANNPLCPLSQEEMVSKVVNGTLLSEGHGRLIDADVLRDYFWDNKSKLYTHKDLQIVIDRQPTVIEADKGEEYEPDDWDSLANAERDH